MHGGKAPQVAARREARILEAEARLRGEAATPRDPGEALVAAAEDADGMLQRLKADMRSGTLQPAQLLAFGDWIDRTARIAKTVLDARIDERRARLAERDGQLLASGLTWLLQALSLSESAEAQRAMTFMLRELGEGRVPEWDGRPRVTAPAALPSGVWMESTAAREWGEVREVLEGVLGRLGHGWDDPDVQAAVREALDEDQAPVRGEVVS